MAVKGVLHIVATPIGNLDDITLRAIETLRTASLVACEDTRHTKRLLDRHGITAKCVSYHKFNESRAVVRILAELEAGHDVAIVSDGGTPAISDPGYLVVSSAVGAGIEVRAIPGACAAIAALSASGLPTNEFTFRGFLPHRRAERRRVIASLATDNPTQIFYESPGRIAESLGDMAEVLGPRHCAVVREMTKKFEQWERGPLDEVASRIAAARGRGEFCIIVDGASASVLRASRAARRALEPSSASPDAVPLPPPAEFGKSAAQGSAVRPEGQAGESTGAQDPSGDSAGGAAPDSAAARIASLSEGYRALLAGGFERREAIKRLARLSGLPRSEVYRRLVQEKWEQTGKEEEESGATDADGGGSAEDEE